MPPLLTLQIPQQSLWVNFYQAKVCIPIVFLIFIFAGKTYTRKPQASFRALPEVTESEWSYHPDDLSDTSEASSVQSPPKPPPRQRGKQRKSNENPKTLPTLNEPVDPRDNSAEPRSPIRKRSALTKSTKARGGNAESETPLEKEPQPPVPGNCFVFNRLYIFCWHLTFFLSLVKKVHRNHKQVVEENVTDDKILDSVEQQSPEVQPKNSRQSTHL